MVKNRGALEFAKGKNAIELGSEAEVADVLAKVREAAELGELDALIEKQAHYGCQRQSKFGPKGSAKCCHIEGGVMRVQP